MSVKKTMKGVPLEYLAAEGLFHHDWASLTPCQRECTARVGMTMQLEQEAYLTEHPEVDAMLVKFLSVMASKGKKKNVLEETALHFCRPADVLDQEIRKMLNLPPTGPYKQENKPTFKYNDLDLMYDIKKIVMKYYPPPAWKIPTPEVKTPNTASSSFLSLVTSNTTQPTPEPVRTPEPTLSETMFVVVSNAVDKAIYQHVDDPSLRYDTAYVELMKAVEVAMEIPVIEVREDIAKIFYNAYKLFELITLERERIAAEMAWEKRMRKKLKRSLRRLHNFKGYETPPTPRSVISSHESYKLPPQRPCVCHPQFRYNRYAKDRFGIYLPREEDFPIRNTTATPAISVESLNVEADVDAAAADTKSVVSRKSAVSRKSNVSKKTAKIQA